MSAVDYPPPRRRGLVVHLVLILVLALFSSLAAWQAFEAGIGFVQILLILVAALTFFPLPFLAYRLYALMGASYSLSRDSLRLRWGLRIEDIPISEVEWVRTIHHLAAPLRLPRLRMPGSVLGARRQEGLGVVEFIASDEESLVLVATARRIFAISPQDTTNFVQKFARTMEMGSLTPASAKSLYPSFVVIQAWESLLARYLWLSGVFLNIGLFIWVSLLIPGLERIPLGFMPSGVPLEPVPGVRLILLPLISIFFFVLGWMVGLFFYRQPRHRPLSLMIWASGTMTALLFLVAVLFLVTTPV